MTRLSANRGQLSLEALFAMAVFLSAVAILIFSAEKIGEGLRLSSQSSSERYSLSYEALSIDTAAGSLASSRFERNLSGVPSQDGRWLNSGSHPSVREPLFHEVSAGQAGGFYVQKFLAEPV